MNRTKLALTGYILFGLAAALLFALFKFPYDAVGHRILAEANKGLPVRIMARETTFSPLPPRLNLADASLWTDAGVRLLTAQEARLSPSLGSLLSGEVDTRLELDVAGGRIEADIAADDPAKPTALALSLTATGIDLSRLPVLARRAGGEVSGTVSVSAELAGDPRGISRMAGTLEFTAQGLAVPVRSPYLRVQTLELGRVEGGFTLDKGVATIPELRFSSDMLQGTAAGSIRLNQNLPRSVLDIQGAFTVLDPAIVNPEAIRSDAVIRLIQNKARLPLRLVGPIERATFRPF